MQYPQARNLKPQFEAAGFTDVEIVKESEQVFNERGEPPWDLVGWVIKGRAYVNSDRPVPFSIRSPKMARKFLADYRAQQADRIEVTSGLG